MRVYLFVLAKIEKKEPKILKKLTLFTLGFKEDSKRDQKCLHQKSRHLYELYSLNFFLLCHIKKICINLGLLNLQIKLK